MTEEPSYMMAERFTDLQSGAKMRLLLQRMEQEGESIVHLLITKPGGRSMALGSMAYRLFHARTTNRRRQSFLLPHRAFAG